MRNWGTLEGIVENFFLNFYNEDWEILISRNALINFTSLEGRLKFLFMGNGDIKLTTKM